MKYNFFMRYKLSILLIKLISVLIPIKKYRGEVRLFLNQKLKIDYNKNYVVREYLKKYTYIPIENFKINNVQSSDLPIWQLWFQGEDSAPVIVKRCLESVRKFSGNRQVILLTKDNIREYVELPQYIWEKKEQSIISNTHFSDILRIYLLEKFGGTWLDSTVLLTDYIPQKILNQDFFAFSIPQDHMNYDFHLFSSWFIHAQPNHIFLKSFKETLFEYWKHENELIDYFTLHLITYNVIHSNEALLQIWKNRLDVNNIAPHEMQVGLLEPYSKDKFEYYKTRSTIHKLTYKIKNVNKENLLNRLIHSSI